MSNVDWEKVETIVDEVLELPAEENWIEFVEKRCGNSPEMKSEVTQLLQSIFKSEGWLENPDIYRADLFDSSLEESPATSQIGNNFGAYRATDIIAEGGMGAVYLGKRADGEFEHTVAIKVIKVGMDTRENVRLFNRERNILAGLNHPGIAKLFDGGVLEHGAPYLIMEYVEGTPMDQYCDKNRLTVNERIDLFKKVLEAVQHAHENLIIHRDLKPDNIFITEQGQVKILDFGIAKLVDTEESSDENLNITQNRILTPKYAAPEQIREEPVTTAADLYSLGIILHQLLIGCHPYELKNKSAYEAERIILDNEPGLPSHRLKRHPDSEKLAAKRSKKATSLVRHLKGDLDAILLKAIEKKDNRRYRNSQELIDELEKYRAGLPISARKSSFGYRGVKFYKRNQSGIAVAAGILLLMISFTTFYTWRITEERNQAQVEANKAEQVTEFLVSLFGSSNPYLETRDGGTDVTVGSILKFGTKKIDDELSDQPAVMAELKTVLGEVYDALSEYDQAEILLKEAIAIRRSSGQVSNFEMANSIRNLGRLYQEQGKFDEAEELLQESISLYGNSSKGLQNHDAISAFARLGNLYWYNKGDYESADSLLNRVLILRQSIHDSSHVHIAINYNDLATLYHAQGDYKTAEPYYRNSIATYKKLFEEHSNLAIIMANFSALLKERGEYQEAESFQKESLSIHQKLTGDDNIDIALGFGNLGEILLRQNRLHEADSLLASSLNMFEDIFNSSHTYISRTKLNVGRLYLKQQNYPAAEEIIIETKNEYEQLFPEGHPRRSDPLVELGNLYLAQGLAGKAELHLKEAVEIRKNGYGEDNWRTAQATSLLGRSFYQLGKFEQAEPLLLHSYQIIDDKRSNNDQYRIQTLKYIVQLYDDWKKPGEKEKFQSQL